MIEAILILFALVNSHREPLPEYQFDARLQQVAQWKAEDMRDNGYVGHVDSQGRLFTETMCEEGGYCYNSYRGENVAAGWEDTEAAFSAFSGSPTHNSLMLSEDYIVTGIGYAEGGPHGRYWVQMFGSYDSCDLDLDGRRSFLDVLSMKPYVTENWTYNPRYDITWDGRISITDALAWKVCMA